MHRRIYYSENRNQSFVTEIVGIVVSGSVIVAAADLLRDIIQGVRLDRQEYDPTLLNHLKDKAVVTNHINVMKSFYILRYLKASS